MVKPRFFLLISALGGISMALAAPPTSWSLLAWFSFIPLWWAVLPWEELGLNSGREMRRSIAAGWVALVWGGVHYGWLLHWIWDLHPLTWMGVPWLASVAIAVGAWIALTGIMTSAVWAWVMLNRWIWRWVGQRRRNPPLGWVVFTSIVLGLALWQGLQTLPSWTPIAWGNLALTQSPHNIALLHLTQISGPLTLDGLILAINGLLAWGIWGILQGRRRFVAILLGIGLAVGLGLGAVGRGLAAGAIADRPDQGVTIGLIQGNVPTRVKLTREGLRAAEVGYSQGYRELVAAGAEAVVLPEGALPVLWEGLNRAYSEVYRTVRQGSAPMWVGTFLRPEADRVGDFTQSLLAVEPGGAVTARYNKVKLVPFGEYIPFSAVLSRFLGKLSPIDSVMLPGLPPQRFETAWGAVAIAICYEPYFPEIVRQQVAAGGQFIVTLSNLDPYGPRLMAQHEAQDVIQAVAFDRWLVRVTNTGYSGFVSPRGAVRHRLGAGIYGTALDRVYRRQHQTRYGQWGDWLTPLWIGVALLGLRHLSHRHRPPDLDPPE